MDEKCCFCGRSSDKTSGGPFTLNVCCANCGNYTIDVDTDCTMQGDSKRHIYAGYLYANNRGRGKSVWKDLLTDQDFDEILSSPLVPKTTMEKMENVLLQYYWTAPPSCESTDKTIPYASLYCVNEQELFNILDYFYDKGWVVKNGDRIVRLTIDAVSHAEQLRSLNEDNKRVFVAMQFTEVEGYPSYKDILEKAIKPACKACGFEAYTIDAVEHNNDITDEIFIGLKTSKFVIADFTHNNCGAYFEAGYAQGTGLPVIRTCNKKWFDANGVHFDVNHYNFILWDENDYHSFVDVLKKRIRATIDGAILQ